MYNKYSKDNFQNHYDFTHKFKIYYNFDIVLKDKIDGYEEPKKVVAIFYCFNTKYNENCYFYATLEDFNKYMNGQMSYDDFTFSGFHTTVLVSPTASLEELRLKIQDRMSSRYVSKARERKEENQAYFEERDRERKFYWMNKFNDNKSAQTKLRKEITKLKKENQGLNYKDTKQIECELRQEIGNVSSQKMIETVIEQKMKLYEEQKTEEPLEIVTNLQKRLGLLFLQKLNWEKKYVIKTKTGSDHFDN